MTYRVDYFDDERQSWIACESIRDHIFDDDDEMWTRSAVRESQDLRAV